MDHESPRRSAKHSRCIKPEKGQGETQKERPFKTPVESKIELFQTREDLQSYLESVEAEIAALNQTVKNSINFHFDRCGIERGHTARSEYLDGEENYNTAKSTGPKRPL